MEKTGERCPPQFVEQARELIEQVLEGHAPRTGYVLAEQLKNRGKASEAISELYKVRAEFEAKGDSVLAAQAARALVEVLIPAGRVSEARFVGGAALEELEAAGMLLEARRLRELLGFGPEKGAGWKARARGN
jgi:hypothetical protein